MNLALAARTAHGPTALFVLLWSSGALFAHAGLASASPLAFLVLRFAVAFPVLCALALACGRQRPAPGTAPQVAATGALLVGGYSLAYLLALQGGVTPGVLATVLGVQPVLTLLATERRFSPRRLAGLAVAFAGLVLVVADSLAPAGATAAGLASGLAALACVTLGSLLQKRLGQAPLQVLPLQYGVGLALALALLPWQPWQVRWDLNLLVCVGWLALVISVAATLLLYRLMQAGNLVDVTSLFYLVPAGTALLDWLVFGHSPAALALAGMALVVAGLWGVLGRGPGTAPATGRRA